LELLKETLGAGWIGTTLGIVGIGLAIYFYIRTKPSTRILYQTGGVRLIGEHSALPNEVSVSFREVPVRALTTSTIVVWNGGNTTIDGNSVVQSDPLRFCFGVDAQILSTEVLKTSREVVRFSLVTDADRSAVLIAFDFLDPNDGAVVKILHTGGEVHGEARGTIKGMPQGALDAGSVIPPEKKQRSRRGLASIIHHRRAVSIVTVVVGCMIVASGLFPGFVLKYIPMLGKVSEPTFSADATAWSAVVVGMLYLGMGCFILYTDWRRYPKSLGL
jgi:hypothetical protein